MLYGFVYYVANAVLAFGIFPVLFPLINWRSLSNNAKRLFVFLILLLLVSAAVVAYTITVREDFPNAIPRAHLRYICFLFVPFIIVFFQPCEPIMRCSHQKAYVITAVLIIFAIIELFI